METEKPSPETVTLLRTDFDMLQGAVNAVVEDVTALASLLGVKPPDGVSPHLVMTEFLLPAVARLVLTQREVDKANKQIEAAAARFGPGEVNPATGRLEQKVGQRIPGGLGLQPMSRRERREFERSQRR